MTARFNVGAGGELPNVVATIARAGGTVAIADAAAPRVLQVRPDGSFVVCVGEDVSRPWLRWTLARAFGAYCTQVALPRECGAEPTLTTLTAWGAGPVEWESVVFAGELLMPTGPFLSASRHFDGDEAALAAVFDVPASAVRAHRTALGLA